MPSLKEGRRTPEDVTRTELLLEAMEEFIIAVAYRHDGAMTLEAYMQVRAKLGAALERES